MKSISVSDLIVKWFIGFRPANCVHRKHIEQWWIQDILGGANPSGGGENLLLGKIFAPKTA